MAKRGRPAKVLGTPITVNTLAQACDTLTELVSEIKDFGISFDSTLNYLQIVWKDDFYKVHPKDLKAFIECVKFTDSRLGM